MNEKSSLEESSHSTINPDEKKSEEVKNEVKLEEILVPDFIFSPTDCMLRMFLEEFSLEENWLSDL